MNIVSYMQPLVGLTGAGFQLSAWNDIYKGTFEIFTPRGTHFFKKAAIKTALYVILMHVSGIIPSIPSKQSYETFWSVMSITIIGSAAVLTTGAIGRSILEGRSILPGLNNRYRHFELYVFSGSIAMLWTFVITEVLKIGRQSIR